MSGRRLLNVYMCDICEHKVVLFGFGHEYNTRLQMKKKNEVGQAVKGKIVVVKNYSLLLLQTL